MRIEKEDERSFYEIESAKSGWSVRTLQRQYNSSLYERLAFSRDKEAVLQLANEIPIFMLLNISCIYRIRSYYKTSYDSG